MSGSRERTKKVWLCHTDTQSTGSGHPLTVTWYDYDRDGKIKDTLKEFCFCDDKSLHAGFPMRQTTRDAFGIIVSEEVFGEDLSSINIPRNISYEKDESGLVHRVVETIKDWETKRTYGFIRYITYDHHHPYRSGLVSRARELTVDGDFEYEYQYEYDDHGQVIAERHLQGQDGPLILCRNRTIEYDEHGNPIRYHQDRERAVQNTYDEQGLLQTAVVWEKSDATGEWEIYRQHAYTYEEHEVVIPKVFPFPK